MSRKSRVCRYICDDAEHPGSASTVGWRRLAHFVLHLAFLAALMAFLAPFAGAQSLSSDPRVYELVSPAYNRGPVTSRALSGAVLGFIECHVGINGCSGLLPVSNLLGQLERAVDVQADGSSVFWESDATPPGTGALPDGLSRDTFRAERTPTGWSTRDLLPYAYPYSGPGAEELKLLVGASADGSAALIASNAALTPSTFVNPHQLYEAGERLIYRVSTDGSPPQIVTHGEYPLPITFGKHHFFVLSASPDLKAVAFVSEPVLEAGDSCNHELDTGRFPEDIQSTVYLWRVGKAGEEPRARTIVSLGSCTAPNVAGVPAVLPDRRPVIEPNPLNPLGPQKLTHGPLVVNEREVGRVGALTPLAGPGGGVWLGDSSDGATAYVASSEALDPSHPGAGAVSNIYAVSTSPPGEGKEGVLHGVVCISCAVGGGSFVALSRDGSHLFFRSADGSLWGYDAAAAQPLGLVTQESVALPIVMSHNGRYVVADTSGGLRRFSGGQESVAIDGCGSPVGVSDDAQRIVCDNTSAGLGVIDEWVAGQIRQISPQGSPNGYSVQRVAGDELQDVFFLANEPLVSADGNTLSTDVYDARIDGGFPPCTPGNPEPPAGVASCLPGSTQNPTSPPIPPHAASLTLPSFILAALPSDTSQSTVKSKSLTRAQKLLRALKMCRKKSGKKRRVTCERQARSKYAPAKKTVMSQQKRKK
jgi:hypothetical protein